MRKIVDKKVYKHSKKQCLFCGESNYATLNVHRIKEGYKGGIYSEDNIVCCCNNCHNKIHDKQITIDKYYQCTDGTLKLRCFINDVEKFL